MRLRVNHFVTRLAATILALLSWTGFGAERDLQAEFLKTGEGVYQNTSLREKVIVSRKDPGIFILVGPPTDLQLFHPSQIDPQKSQHVFLRSDEGQNMYSAMLIGRTEYRIRGSFTVTLGPLRITVDNNNPYCSIVADDTSKGGNESAILGLRGLDVVVNSKGNDALIALLEGNQFSRRYQGIINPYEIREGALLLQGSQIQSQSVGLGLEPPKNPCLPAHSGVRYLTRSEINGLKALAGDEQVRRLDQLLQSAKGREPFAHLLILQVTNESLVGVDYQSGEVKLVKELKSLTSKTRLCVIDDVVLE